MHSISTPKRINDVDPRDLPPRQVQFFHPDQLCYKGAGPRRKTPLSQPPGRFDPAQGHGNSSHIVPELFLPRGGLGEGRGTSKPRTPRKKPGPPEKLAVPPSHPKTHPLPSLPMVIIIACCPSFVPPGAAQNAPHRPRNNCFVWSGPPYPSHGYPGRFPTPTPRCAPCSLPRALPSRRAFWPCKPVVRARQNGDAGRQLKGIGRFRTTPLCTPTYIRCPPTRPRPLPIMSQ